jgi:6-phosphogluconolactonase
MWSVIHPKVIPVEDRKAFVRAAAQHIVAEIDRSIAERGGCSMALAGGETPRPVYQELARPGSAELIDWSKVDLYFSDERCVPPDDPVSNYGMVRETLLASETVKPAAVHRIQGELGDRERAASEYESLLPPALDLLLLGMGADGHTASLFPGEAALNETERRVIVAVGGNPPLPRITVTPRVIGEARSLLVLISGESKAETVRRAIDGPYDPSALPIQLAGRGMWILDGETLGSRRERE